jgi:hypothetical protein
MLPWNLNQPISTFAGVTVNGQGCLVAFRDPRPRLDTCVRLQGSYNLTSDFSIFNFLRDSIGNMWSRNGVDLFETQVLNISPLRRADTGTYVCSMLFPTGTVSLFPNLTLVQNRSTKLKFCCTTTRDTVRQTICEGNCIEFIVKSLPIQPKVAIRQYIPWF